MLLFCKNRCEVLDFQLSKSQKKIIKKVTKFLKSGECDKNPTDIVQAEREPCMKYEFHGNLYLLLFLFIYPIYECYFLPAVLNKYICTCAAYQF